MCNARANILAGTALALVLAVPSIGLAEPKDSLAGPSIQSAPRDYITPGSMPKPSSMLPDDDGLRFRGPIPATEVRPPEHRATAAPSAPINARKRPDVEAAQAQAPSRSPSAAPAATPASHAGPAAATRKAAPVARATAPAAPEPAPAGRETAPAAAARQVPAPVVQREAPRSVPATTAPTGPAFNDGELAGKLREIVGNRQLLERLVTRKADRDAIASFYQKDRNFQPLWVAQGGPSERSKDVIEYLKTIDADGLDPTDYPVPKFGAHSAAAQAEAELKFTETVLTYSRHAMTGRVHFTRVSPNIDYKLAFDADDVLKRIAASDDLPKTLESFNPQQPAYKALKAKLAEFRNEPAEEQSARIASGAVLKYYRDRNRREYIMRDPRVPLLRERLGLPPEQNDAYNLALANAVAKFQKAHGIQATGQLNGPTIEAMNGPSRAKQLDAILATMERWRWMPRNLGETHIVLNIPDFNLRVYHNGAKVWQTKVVVGKPDHQTPLLTETMKYITLNPTWNVPQSIIYNELLPIYETSDPQIFERQGLKVERDRDGSIRVYQPPGERNALGQIRFNFPNKFLVYQHDTPERYYFAQERRAYSHGCMRVQDPAKYAEVLLSYASPRGGYTEASIKRMLGGQEQQIDFHNQLPVHITYQTAFVDEAGKLQLREDIYGLDAKLMSILKSPERAVADTAIERPADPNFKPTADQGRRLNSVAGGGAQGPFALFEHIFR